MRDHVPHLIRNTPFLHFQVELRVGKAVKDVFDPWNPKARSSIPCDGVRARGFRSCDAASRRE